jgi:hypothetical protein
MDRLTARRALEALRFGVVPTVAIEDVTSLRGPLLSTCRQLVGPHAFGLRGLVVEGEYGYGKTHVLRYLQERALKRGYATSFVEIDDPLRASRFHRLYGATVGNTRVKDYPGSVGFRPLLWHLFNDDARSSSLAKGATRWPLNTALRILRRCFSEREHLDAVEDNIWAWISGAPITATMVRGSMLRTGESPPSTIKLYDVDFQRVLTQWTQLLTHLGYKGWLLLLDEVENVTLPGTSISTRSNAYRGLDFLLEAKIANFAVVCAITPQARLDIENDLAANPWLPAGRILAHTVAQPTEDTDQMVVHASLHSPSPGELVQIGAKIRDIHAKANGWDPRRAVDDDLLEFLATRLSQESDGPLREYVRGVVAVLDVAKDNRDFRPESLRWI